MRKAMQAEGEGKWYLVKNGEIIEVCNSYDEANDLLNEYDVNDIAELEIYPESAWIRW